MSLLVLFVRRGRITFYWLSARPGWKGDSFIAVAKERRFRVNEKRKKELTIDRLLRVKYRSFEVDVEIDVEEVPRKASARRKTRVTSTH